METGWLSLCHYIYFFDWQGLQSFDSERTNYCHVPAIVLDLSTVLDLSAVLDLTTVLFLVSFSFQVVSFISYIYDLFSICSKSR
jgi:hypothetical protein